MADEETVVQPEGASEETKEEDKPAAEEQGDDTAAEATAEAEAEAAEKTEAEAAPEAETEQAEDAPEPEAAPEQPEAEPEGGAEPEADQQQEVMEEESTAAEVEAAAAAATEEEQPAPEEPTEEKTAEPDEPEAPPEAEEGGESAPEGEPAAEAELADLTEEERETFSGLFDMYATVDESDGQKKITRAGIKLLFRYMGEIVTEAIVTQWLREEDRNADDKFDFEEFCSLYKKKRQSEDARKEELLLCVNTLFPTNGDNNDSIDLEKVAQIMNTINGQPGLISENSVLTEEEVRKIIEKIDTDHSNHISRQEFVEFLCSKSE